MMRLLLLSALIAAVSSCASAPRAWASESQAYREEGDYDRRGYDDAPVAEATAAAPGSPLDFVGDAVDGFFGGGGDSSGNKSASAPPSPPRTPPPTPPTDPANPDPDIKPMEAAKRLVIYTGTMSLIVPSTEVATDAFLKQIEGMGGYLQQRSSSTITVRVPAPKFFEVLDGLRKSGTVTDEQVNAQDVTKRVFDIELRLQTAEESRKRLVEILKAATKIEDILRIEGEIRRLTEEIEGMKGELRNLGDQVAFSTLTVNFYANAPSPRPYPDRTRSRFDWINQIGVEQVLYGF